jgi:hypothetical protein
MIVVVVVMTIGYEVKGGVIWGTNGREEEKESTLRAGTMLHTCM